MTIKTVNPYSGQTLTSYSEDSEEQVRTKLSELKRAQQKWKLSIEERLKKLGQVRERFNSSIAELAKLMSSEMGKPVTQSEAELKKCVWLFDYLVENAKTLLAPENVKTEAKKSYIRFDPVGTVLLVMPWNFPAWQVVRAAVPALTVGNAVILKHASIVSGSSLKLEEIFDLDVFKSTVISGKSALNLIKYVDGVSFTGSTEIGTKIGEEAGRHLKKCVLELGGSDPYVVIDDTNIEDAIKNCTYARLQNNGQSCIASKRFIVHEKAYEKFYEGMKREFSNVKIGDPLDKSTFLGPLSSKEQKQTVVNQIQALSKLGGIDQLGESLEGNFVPPTIVKTDAHFDEEVFGPVAILTKVRNNDEAVRLANDTEYGLGASIWGDPDEAEKLVPQIEAGMVFINKVVASDPRLPFGGVKKSGLGVELSRYGLLEFTHKRTVWIN
jgi:succinate-semialdehyde dehydrogenase/glutarate-semialdehyde dehydrogenase